MSAHILVWICTNAPLLAQKGWALYDYETRVRGVQVAVHREGEKPGDKKRKLAPRLVHLNDHHLGHLESHDEKPHEEEHSDDNDDAKSVETTLESAEKENKPGRVFLISKDSAIEPHTLAGEVLEDWFKWGSIPQFGENGTISGYQRTQPGYLLVHGAGKSDGTSSCHWLTSCMGKLGCGNGGKDFDAMQMIITKDSRKGDVFNYELTGHWFVLRFFCWKKRVGRGSMAVHHSGGEDMTVTIKGLDEWVQWDLEHTKKKGMSMGEQLARKGVNTAAGAAATSKYAKPL